METTGMTHIKKEEDFIFNNENSFIDNFCRGSTYELNGVSFSSNRVYINYWRIESGQHYTNSFTYDLYNEWKASIHD